MVDSISADESKTVTFGEFQHILAQTTAIAVLKFWAMVLTGFREVSASFLDTGGGSKKGDSCH